jgi:branched-subunit amino acid ABC-type transport system permease component
VKSDEADPQILSRLLKGAGRHAAADRASRLGLANGAIYACLALALVMIFVSTDHINFAQGELAMFSAYLVWQALEWGVSFWVALPVVALLSFLIGVAVERVILRPLHHAPILSVVVVFIGLLAIFHSLAAPSGATPSRRSPRRSRKSPSPAPATSARIRSA